MASPGREESEARAVDFLLLPFARQTMSLRLGRDRKPLAALFLFAAVVRLIGLQWDQGHHFHPDERAIAMAIERITFVPLQLNPHFFAYGSFPLYVTRVVTSILGKFQGWFAGYDGI